jgi:hypothetical protein
LSLLRICSLIMSGRGRRGGRGGGRGRGRGGRGRGRGRGPRPNYTQANQQGQAQGQQGGGPDTAAGDQQKRAPKWLKIANLAPFRTAFIVAKITNVNTEAQRPVPAARANRRGAEQRCTEALIGDDTASIRLTTRVDALSNALKQNEGNIVGLLNVRLIRAGDQSYIDIDQFGEIKSLADIQSLLPADFNTTFEISDNNISKRKPPKPTWSQVEDLQPEQENVNLIVKVIKLDVSARQRDNNANNARPFKTAEAVVADTTGAVEVSVRNDQLVDKLQEGKIVAIQNSRIEMHNKMFMRLVVNRWSDIHDLDQIKELLPDNRLSESSQIKDENRSKIEWVLQEE